MKDCCSKSEIRLFTNLSVDHNMAFLARHSTVTQLLECTNDWTISMVGHEVADGVHVNVDYTIE